MYGWGETLFVDIGAGVIIKTMETVRVYFEGYIDQEVPKNEKTHEEAKRIVTNKMIAEKAVIEITGTDNPSDYEN